MPRLRLAELQAHPRVCGENAFHSFLTVFTRGSSPRVRGKPIGGLEDDFLNRLIPACAGKTS